jgi:hypothetical protein
VETWATRSSPTREESPSTTIRCLQSGRTSAAQPLSVLAFKIAHCSVEFGVRAGQRALDLSAPQAAVEQLSRAIDAAEHPGVTTPPEVHRQRGMAHEMLRDFDAALEDFEAAVEPARSNGARSSEFQTQLDLGGLWSSRDFTRYGDPRAIGTRNCPATRR